MRDVTGRLRADAAAREREHFVKRVLMVAPGVTGVFDVLERRYVFVSNGVATMLGYRSDEIVAMG